MHAFFINTSKKELNSYQVLLDMHLEDHSLVMLEKPLADWLDDKKGYLECANTMGEMIDGYKELGNDFSLIIYVDLVENGLYSGIKKEAESETKRQEYMHALELLYTHFMKHTLVSRLENTGRKPKNVLIMFGAEHEICIKGTAESGVRDKGVAEAVLTLLGMPDDDVLKAKAKAVAESGVADMGKAFRHEIEKIKAEELMPLDTLVEYGEVFNVWFDRIAIDGKVETANEELYTSLRRIFNADLGRGGMSTVICPYDSVACEGNKMERACSGLNIVIYLLGCLERGTVFTSSESGAAVAPYIQHSPEKITDVLRKKHGIYTSVNKDLASLEGADKRLGLYPPLDDFNHEKFGLDKFGSELSDLVVAHTETKKDKKKKKEDDADKDDGTKTEDKDGEAKPILITYEGVEVKKEQRARRSLFGIDEYEPFDCFCEKAQDDITGPDPTPDDYKNYSLKIRKHHLDFLKELKQHTVRVLSNYASKSDRNAPALLSLGGKHYSAGKEETAPMETTREIAEEAYKTMTEKFVRFCAGRSVAVTDIEDECNRFIAKIERIEKSLKKIKAASLGMLIFTLLVYAPFFIIQWPRIISGATSLIIALCSIGIPLALLAFVTGIAVAIQKRKFRKATEEFREKSDAILADNANAARLYDVFLSNIIPSLRWVYEYKLDVGLLSEGCDIAEAKKQHHLTKMRQRIKAIENIVSDIECETIVEDKQGSLNDVELNVPFCVGEKNKKFYSIIPADFWNDPMADIKI